MNCILCQLPKPLRKSHIIPEFAYRGLYDEKHRMVSFGPLSPEKHSSRLQKGLRDRLLCDGCEGFINDNFEKPFLSYFIDGNALDALKGKRVATLTRINYSAFKLFHLSVLFRAHHAMIPNFGEVYLGASESPIREMLLNKNAGKDWEFPIVCSAITQPDGEIWKDIIAPAHSVVLGSQQAFLFTFAGCQWLYFLSSVLTPEIDKRCLKESGELPIAKSDWLAMSHYQSMAGSV
ncbi:MAG: hypothetical protein WD768_05170 [Phycisphaeraceae bacterium]